MAYHTELRVTVTGLLAISREDEIHSPSRYATTFFEQWQNRVLNATSKQN